MSKLLLKNAYTEADAALNPQCIDGDKTTFCWRLAGTTVWLVTRGADHLVPPGSAFLPEFFDVHHDNSVTEVHAGFPHRRRTPMPKYSQLPRHRWRKTEILCCGFAKHRFPGIQVREYLGTWTHNSFPQTKGLGFLPPPESIGTPFAIPSDQRRFIWHKKMLQRERSRKPRVS